MRPHLLDAIPEERREIARAAIGEAFGGAPLTALAPVAGGFSGALTYRIEAGGRPYLLRLEVQRDFFRDPRRSFACMRGAADAGLAPPLRHADPSTGAAIMDFIAQRPLGELPGGAPALAGALGAMVARLQDTPLFPAAGADYPAILSGMLAGLRSSGLFPAAALDPHLEGFLRIRQAFGWDGAALVSSHNDPNPRNLLFDGERLWLVDWELAFRNDRLVDVAILANEFAHAPDLEEALLRAWLGAAPSRLVRARLVLARQLVRLFYGCIILSVFPKTPDGVAPGELAAPSPAEFIAAIAERRLDPASPRTAFIYGKMHLAGFLAGLAAPGFESALAIAEQG